MQKAKWYLDNFQLWIYHSFCECNVMCNIIIESVHLIKWHVTVDNILRTLCSIPPLIKRLLTTTGFSLRVKFFHTRFASQELNFHKPKADNNYGTSIFAFLSSKPWETISTSFKILPYTSFYNNTNYTF